MAVRMKYKNLLFVFLSFVCCNAYSQSVSATSYSLLTDKNIPSFKEKIYVHTDKSFYVAGEIIWFKMYCVEANSNKPVDLSKIAYIELLDSTNKAVAQAKIALHNGLGDGSFYLPVSASSGNYKLRAYTNWMKNDDADNYFEKNITLINIQKLTIDNNNKNEEVNSICFYPEGGNLVNSIKNKVAFKAVNQYGKSINFTGVLMDGNDTLLSFHPAQNGIGSFYITPVKNHTYTTFIQPENSKPFSHNLPNATDEGFTMNIDDAVDSNVVINVATNGIAEPSVYLIIHKNKQAVVAKKTSLQNGKAAFTINTQLLPAGVSTITIFNDNKQPVCERLFYKNDQQDFELSMSAEASKYNIRKKVNLTISAGRFAANSNDSASLSLSVYRLDSLQTLNDNTIDAYLLLTSELKGEVENPSFYLNSNKETATAMNNLLLVNGWRKIKRDITNYSSSPAFSFVPEYNGHIVTGKLVNNQTNLPQKNVVAYLSLPGKSTEFYTSASDSVGNVKWETKDWYGTSKLIAQTDERYDSMYAITINNPFANRFSSSAFLPFTLPFNSPNTLLQHSVAMQVENIYSGNNINQFATPVADSTAFYLSADKKYKLDDYTRFTTIEEVLREYVMLVNVTKRKGEYHFPTFDASAQKMFSGDPLVLVDGVPLFNLNKFIAFDPLKIKTLEVVNRRYIYGNAVFDGILNWQTYNADGSDVDINPKALVIDYDGLQEQRTFYSPAYETTQQLNNHLPDFRTTLYWNANITLKKNEEQQLHFYSSDLQGKYAVVLQGITTNGLCSSKIIMIDVEKK